MLPGNGACRPHTAATIVIDSALVSMRVDDIQESFACLVSLGAASFDPITQRGEG